MIYPFPLEDARRAIEQKKRLESVVQ